MAEKPAVKIIHQVPNHLQDSALKLYLNVFKDNLPDLSLSDAQYTRLLETTLDWRYVWAAIDNDRVVGLAGYQCCQGSFTGASSPLKLMRVLGFSTFLKLVRSPAAQYRAPKHAELLHNGLIVADTHRRLGIATRLLEALAHFASDMQFQQMRLDVAPDNHTALSLYQQLGYSPADSQSFSDHMTMTRALRFA